MYVLVFLGKVRVLNTDYGAKQSMQEHISQVSEYSVILYRISRQFAISFYNMTVRSAKMS